MDVESLKLTGGLISPTVNDQCYCVHSRYPRSEGGLVNLCVCVCVWVGGRAGVRACVCVSEDMSPYCSAHDEWLIMKFCIPVGEEIEHGRTGGWLLVAETISAGQTTRPPEIIIDITSEEIRGHTSLSTALVICEGDKTAIDSP